MLVNIEKLQKKWDELSFQKAIFYGLLALPLAPLLLVFIPFIIMGVIGWGIDSIFLIVATELSQFLKKDKSCQSK